MRVFDIDLGDCVLVVPGLDELPGEILVLGLCGDVPARAQTADRERWPTVLGRMQDVPDVLLRAGLILRSPAAVDPAPLEDEREASVAELRAHGRPGFGRREDLLRREALGVDGLVIGESLADRCAVANALAIAGHDIG